MDHVNQELERLGRALREAPQRHYGEFYAAQQALSWALDAQAFKPPYSMITGTPQDSKDCPEYRGPPQCADTNFLAHFERGERSPHDCPA